MLLENRTAIVTGGVRGIGRAIARRFLEEGARVVVADVDDEDGPQVVDDLGRFGEVRFVPCDVGERLDVRNLVTVTVEAFGGVDVLVNNAAVMHTANFLDLEEEDFDRVIRTNLKGAFLTGQAAARHMVERVAAGSKPGAIVNLSSVNAVVAIANQVPYSVAKGAINQLTKAMALALAPHGIRVNAVGPGSTMTEMLEETLAQDSDQRRRLLTRTPLGRFAEPEEIAAVAAFLASDQASYITGETIYADGGRLALNYTVPVRS